MSEPQVTVAQPARVVVAQPARMNLLGLLLRGVLERRLAAAHGTRLRGDVLVAAGDMHVTLHFDERGVQVTREPPASRALAVVRGTPAALLRIARGHGVIGAWLSGRLRVRGGLLSLWRLLSLFRAGGVA